MTLRFRISPLTPAIKAATFAAISMIGFIAARLPIVRVCITRLHRMLAIIKVARIRLAIMHFATMRIKAVRIKALRLIVMRFRSIAIHLTSIAIANAKVTRLARVWRLRIMVSGPGVVGGRRAGVTAITL